MAQRIHPRLRVFVSSKMDELAPERALVKEALDEILVDAWVLEEDAGARTGSIEETLLEEVRAGDLYLGIFWKGYGPYTRQEFDHAAKLGKDRLVYEKRADLEEREPKLQQFLDELGRVETGVTPKWFHTAEELRDFVKEDVAAWQSRMIQQRHEVEETVKTLTAKIDQEEERQFLQDQVSALTDAVTALASQKRQPDAPSHLDDALTELKEGQTEVAKTLFQQVAEEGEALGTASLREVAEANRHLGALASLDDDTETARSAYRKATELDPENPEGWTQLGNLLFMKGDVAGAEDAYRRVLPLGESARDLEWKVGAMGGLGLVYQIQGHLEESVEMYGKARALYAEFEHEEVRHVFVSYSREDFRLMVRLAEALRQHGFSVWNDRRDLRPGTRQWQKAIEKAIEEARCVIVLMTPRAKDSEWVDLEANYALAMEVRLVPWLAEGDTRSSVPIRLIGTQRIDATKDYATALEALVRTLGSG